MPDGQEENVAEKQEPKREKSTKSSRSEKDEKRSEKHVEVPNMRDENQTPKLSASQENRTKSQENATSAEKPRSSKSRKMSDVPNPKSDLINSKPLLESSKSTDSVNPPKTRAALRSAAMRPISARPSAPRRRDRNVRQILHTESFVQEPNNQDKTTKKSNIPDFDDADNIVITESVPDNISALDETVINKEEGEIDGKVGHLVQQILDTQTSILKDVKNDASAVRHVHQSFRIVSIEPNSMFFSELL